MGRISPASLALGRSTSQPFDDFRPDARDAQNLSHTNGPLLSCHRLHAEDKCTPLAEITPAVIAKYKVIRHKAVIAKKQSRGGAGVALDIAVLHGMFAFAVAQKMLFEKPISMARESKPGENPKNGARPFTGEELAAIRQATVYKNSRKQTIDDTPTFLLLRWVGLRVSDAVRLPWKHVHFGRGTNGEVEILTQKRGKVAIIPLATELRDNLEAQYKDRKASREDYVLLNPQTASPFANRAILSRRAIELCARAGVEGSAHCFRDTFACDMLARGIGVFEVAKMLADTVETVEEYYAEFIPALRDNVQLKMEPLHRKGSCFLYRASRGRLLCHSSIRCCISRKPFFSFDLSGLPAIPLSWG